MDKRIELPASQFKALCAALGYHKRTVDVIATTAVTLQDLNWSGGTRNTYSAYGIRHNEVRTAAILSQPHPWDNKAEGATVPLEPDFAIVRTGFFCGKPAKMLIYVHPDNMPKLLPDYRPPAVNFADRFDGRDHALPF